MLFQFWNQCKNCFFLPQQRYPQVEACVNIIKPGWFLSTRICRQKNVSSRKEILEFCEKSEQKMLLVHLTFSHAKQLLVKLLFENQQTKANLLLGLMLVNYALTPFVNSSEMVFIRIGISIRKRVVSHFDKARHIFFILWSCSIFEKQCQTVKM